MSELQRQIGAILDAHDLPNIAALREKIAALMTSNTNTRETQLLEFVVTAYEHDCDSQE